MFNVRKVTLLACMLQVIPWSIGFKSDGEVADIILKDYKAHHKPSDVLYINVQAGLLSVQELDNKKQFLSCTMWMILSWNDQRLVWNASFSSRKSILVDSNKLWKPELIIGNSAKGQELMHSGGSLLVTGYGNIQWLLAGPVQTRCRINIYKFPFDTQTCEITVMGWFGNNSKIHFFGDTDVDMDDFEENSEFEISHDIGRGYNEGRVSITINLKRRPLFYIFTILLPVVLLHFLNSFVFLLPSQSGEKTSMAVSILLSFQLFLSIIRDSLPENSLTVSLFSLYVSLANATSVIVVVVNILLLKMKETPPPKWILRLCKTDSDSNNVGVVNDNIVDEEVKRPHWADIEIKLNKICFLSFLVFSIGVTAVVLGMLTR
ncbi:neuronal acetylcholine receptor subunit alpha-3-like [Haliotis asinina]|uniref:neuronal acetylcholine receptor subunit alpha-3-like n=1 Tax=Haliotis asinina TaxID=109174 RepID=UPI003532797C